MWAKNISWLNSKLKKSKWEIKLLTFFMFAFYSTCLLDFYLNFIIVVIINECTSHVCCTDIASTFLLHCKINQQQFDEWKYLHKNITNEWRIKRWKDKCQNGWSYSLLYKNSLISLYVSSLLLCDATTFSSMQFKNKNFF